MSHSSRNKRKALSIRAESFVYGWNRRTDILTLYAGSQLAAQAEDLRDEVVADGTGRVHGLLGSKFPAFTSPRIFASPDLLSRQRP